MLHRQEEAGWKDLIKLTETILHSAKGMPQIRRVIDEQVHAITQISVK
jgi:hypothetical protein